MTKTHWTMTSPGNTVAAPFDAGGSPSSAAQHRRSRTYRSALLITTALAGMSIATHAAAQAEWSGAVSSDWTVPGNWNIAFPNANLDVTIDTVTPNPAALNNIGQADRLYVGRDNTGALTIGAGQLLSSQSDIGFAAGSNGTVAVSGADTSWLNTGFFFVGFEGTGALSIDNGGTVTNSFGYVGARAGSTGIATVTGANSSWQNTVNLYVASAGTGTLIVSSGASVANVTGFIGFSAGSDGFVSVADASWQNSHDLYVGREGIGALSIGAGGSVSNIDGYIGFAVGSNGAVSVTGPGASWQNSSFLHVGGEGTGSLAIGNGGAVTNTYSLIGAAADSSGTATISGNGSSWQNSEHLAVGNLGTGALTVASGGTVSNTNGWIGHNAIANGTVTVSGADALWANSADVFVGGFGSGALAIEDGGTVTGTDGYVGFGSTATGTVSVSGVDASWQNAGVLYVGAAGDGTMTIETGGTVLSAEGSVGSVSDAVGAVVVSGTGASWQNSGSLRVADEGTGALTLEGGGAVTSSDGFIGFAPGSSGVVSISGAGTSWNNSGELHIGGNGTGTLSVENGAAVSSNFGQIGSGTSATGSAIVSGNGSTWSNSGNLTIGGFGAGALTIQDGATVSNATGIVGFNAGATGAVSVSGAGSSWQNSGFFFEVGYLSGSTGSMTVADGATVSSNNSVVGTQSGAAGAVIVSGSDAMWQNAGSLNLGYEGTGSMAVLDGGTVINTQGSIGAFSGSSGEVTVSGAGALWQNSATLLVGQVGSGTLTVANGGVVSALSMEIANSGTSTGTLNIGAAAGEAPVAAGTLDTAKVFFGSGTGDLIFNHTATDFLFSPALSGVGSLNHFSGRTVLTGDSTGFGGNTSVHAGTLVVNGILGGTLDVLADGHLEGVGAVGTTTLASGAVLAPGNSIGTLDVVGDITFNAGSIYEVEVDAAGSDSDLVHATGTATLNGGSVAHIGLVGDYKPFSTYTILTADGGVAGTFGDVSSAFAFLDPTLSYDANNVFLQLVRNDITFCSVGQTFNQCATGEGAESLGFGDPLFDALVVLDADTASAAFDRLSGEIHASARTVMLEDSRFVREAATARVRAAFSDIAAPAQQVLTIGDSGPAPAPADTAGLALWGHTFGSWGEWDGDGNAASLDRATGGLVVGADVALGDEARSGVLAGYSRTTFDVDSRTSSGSSDNFHLGLYGGSQWGNLGFSAGAAYTWHDIETSRQVAFPGFSDALSSDHDAATAQLFGELGYRVDTQVASFEPFANLAHVRVNVDGFTETGGAAALSHAGSDTDATFTTLGLRASTGFLMGTMSATARGMIGWRHAYGDVTPRTVHAFAGGDAFQIAGVPIAKNAAVIEAGLDLAVSPTALLGLSYNGLISSRVQDHGLKADFTMRF